VKSKSQLRQFFRELRGDISLTIKNAAAQSAATWLTTQEIFKSSEHIACYLPVKNEFDTSYIIDNIWNAKKNCYLPILNDDHALRFLQFEKGDKLRLNRYSIPEPLAHSYEIALPLLDMVIMPLLAFDMRGIRLGAGGGYYDKTFAFLQANKAKKPFMLGLGYANQEANNLPYDTWDILLDGILTEKIFHIFT